MLNPETLDLDIGEIAPKLAPLFDESKRYRFYVLHGGRNSTKSHTVAKRLISFAIGRSCRILCTREIQKTIKDSVHQLLWDQIIALGCEHLFEKTDNEIKCNINDSYFRFGGLKSDPAGIKSKEGYDYLWVEEAQNISFDSWENVIPTIRKEGSEIYVVFNDDTEYDETYIRFITTSRPDVLAIKINYTDIPKHWTSKVTWAEIEYDKASDPAKYRHKWLGEPSGYSGRIFPTFREDVHVVDFDLSFLKQCNCFMSIDPHPQYYPYITWYAITPNAAIIAYNEYPKWETLNKFYDEIRNEIAFNKSAKELADIILANDYSLEYGAEIIARVFDPHYERRKGGEETPEIIKGLQENGVRGWVPVKFERIEEQRVNITRALTYNPNLPLIEPNVPYYYVRKECRNKKRGYLSHSWDKEKGKEKETFKDIIDVDRYMFSLLGGKVIYTPKVAKSAYDSPVKSLLELRKDEEMYQRQAEV